MKPHAHAFRFMVSPGHCPMISKYGPSLFKAVGPRDPPFSCEKSHFNKKYSSYSESTNSIKQKVHVGCQYSKTCLKQPLKKDKTKILITNGSLKKVERIAECYWEHSAIPLTCINQLLVLKTNFWSSFLSGRLRQVNTYMHTSVCVSV